MITLFWVLMYVAFIGNLVGMASHRLWSRKLKATNDRAEKIMQEFEHPQPPAEIETKLDGLAAAYLEDPDPVAELRAKTTADALRKCFGIPDVVLATVLLMVWEKGSALMDEYGEEQFGQFLEALGLAAVDLSALERELAP